MNVVAILIVWSLPLLPTGGPGRSPSPGGAALAGFHVTSAVIRQPIEVFHPGDPGKGNLGASLRDEEDFLDDLLIETGPLSPSLWGAHGKAHRSSIAGSQHDLPRSPALPLPLRC